MKIDVIDNGGQWTHREWRVLRDLGVESRIVPNTADSHDLDGLDGLVLSGGAPSIVSSWKAGKHKQFFQGS
jgi:GMP synthase - Glutamine amidotransferase domain